MRKLWLVLVVLMVASTMVFASGANQQQQQQQGASSSLTRSNALTVMVFNRGSDGGRSLAQDNAWTNWIKAKVKQDLGLDVTFVPVGRFTEDTELPALMASQSAPDLCNTWQAAMLAEYKNLGGLLDLAPYIDTYLPDLKALLGADTALGGDLVNRQKDPVNGMIPYIHGIRTNVAQRNVFIRQDWLTALNLPMPTTITQFYNTLVQFRDNVARLPGGVTAARVVPLMTGDDVRWTLADFMNNYITPGMNARDRWVYAIYESNLMMPNYKAGVQEMNKWYNERLIYQDFPLMKSNDDYNNMLKSGMVGAFSANWDTPFRPDYNINTDLARNVPGAEFVPVDLNLINKDVMDKTGICIFIPKFSKNQEGALRYLNWLAKPENYRFLLIGNIGINHDMVEGFPRAKPATGQWIMNSANNVDIVLPINGIHMGNDADNATVLGLSYPPTAPEKVSNAYLISVKDGRAPSVFQANLLVTQYSQTLVDKRNALLAQSIAAPTAQFSATYDRLYQDWLASGAQAVYDERNRAYPR